MTATVKHPSLKGVRLVIVEPLNVLTGQPEGLAQIAADRLGAGRGQRVLCSGDGKGAQEILGADKTCPVRLTIVALLDGKSEAPDGGTPTPSRGGK